MAKKTLYLAFPICDEFQRYELDKMNYDELFETMCTSQNANEDLKKYNAEIGVYDHDGEFSVTVVANGEEREFADGYYEDELGDLINDAWAHAKAKVKPQMAYRVTAYYDVELGCEPEILIEVYATEKLAKQRVAQLIKRWKDGWKRTEDDADDWTEKDDSLEAYKDSEWNVDIFWMPEPIRNKIG